MSTPDLPEGWAADVARAYIVFGVTPPHPSELGFSPYLVDGLHDERDDRDPIGGGPLDIEEGWEDGGDEWEADEYDQEPDVRITVVAPPGGAPGQSEIPLPEFLTPEDLRPPREPIRQDETISQVNDYQHKWLEDESDPPESVGRDVEHRLDIEDLLRDDASPEDRRWRKEWDDREEAMRRFIEDIQRRAR